MGAAESAPEEGAGDLIFFEALPVKPPRLQTDIMTPHMGKWYEAGGQVKNPWDEKEAERVPGDWHAPVPIPFLTVEQATFQVAVAPRPRSEAGAGDVEAALDKLAEALAWLGAGGKTAVGYGHMVPDPQQRDAIQAKLESARREQEAAAQAEARKALAPEEQALLAFEDLMAEERQAGITERSQSALPERARSLMDQAEAEQWAQPLRHRLADLVEAAYRQVGGYSRNRKNAIKAQIARLRGETED
ncbi:MAG: type III-B CRISPR module RAMP protein Cmr6 [Thiohalorhabdaceae bacterium]